MYIACRSEIFLDRTWTSIDSTKPVINRSIARV